MTQANRKIPPAPMPMTAVTSFWPWTSLALLAAATISSTFAILLFRPLLLRYALVIPSGRSAHATPTPQGGGIAVTTTILVTASTAALYQGGVDPSFWAALAGAALLSAVGTVDDIKGVSIAPRIGAQALAVGAIVISLPAELTVLSPLPLPIERALLFLAGVWFVNLVNFMDGIDWMTVATVVPICAGLVLLASLGTLPLPQIILSTAVLGAMIGFAPFNRPVAKLFLGDSGSLPIGLLTGWLLAHLATRGYLVSAILLPLYYLADATVTLIRRMRNGEHVWSAHRAHFYQRAIANGYSVPQVISRVFLLNAGLATLAIVSALAKNGWIDALALAVGGASVMLLLRALARAKA